MNRPIERVESARPVTPKDKKTGAERRKFARFAPDKYRATVKKKGLIGGTISERLVDLSEGGAQFISLQPIKKGAFVKLSVHMEKFGDTIGAEGQVLWVRQQSTARGDQWRCGILFTDLPDDARRKLANNASWFTSEVYLARKRQREREAFGFS